jgi:subtilisin family serine protease
MSRRAAPLVAFTGLFAYFTLSASLLVAQAPRKAIKSASDLPAFGYSISYPTPGSIDGIRSEDAFRPFAEKLRRDIESLLRDYSIEDRTTLRELHQTLLSLDLFENRTAEARKEIAIVRDLQDRPIAKLMSVLFQEALLDSGWPKRDPQEFLRRFSAALNRLPWDVVSDQAKARKADLQSLAPADQDPPLETRDASPVRKTRQVDLRTAQMLVAIRYRRVIVAPLKDQAIEAFAAYIAAHKDAKPTPDIWPARSVTLHAGDKAKPVVIGIWDSGVDRSLFRGQLATDGPVPGFDFYGNRTEGELLAFDAKQKERWPQTKNLLMDASAMRKVMSAATPEEAKAVMESMNFGGHYIHGTHVAGIALEGNPFGRLLVVREAFPNQVPPPPPTLAGATKFAAGAGELTAYLRKHGARVVNMSWTITLKDDFEQNLQANNVGADAAERRKMALEMLGVVRDGLRAALTSTREILYIAAAGNSNSNSTFDEDVWASMKDLPNLLVVGAVDQAGNEASFTSFGPAVTVYANGFQVESYIPGGERWKRSGTSMAAPNVTNLAAKLIALDPSLTPTDVVKLIRDGSDLSADGRFRLINPKRSVELLKARSR